MVKMKDERWSFFLDVFSRKLKQGCHLEIPGRKTQRLFFGEFLFMGFSKICERCVFLVSRSVVSSLNDLVDQVHLVDQVPFWS